jgi:hypothetical protein
MNEHAIERLRCAAGFCDTSRPKSIVAMSVVKKNEVVMTTGAPFSGQLKDSSAGRGRPGSVAVVKFATGKILA